MRGARMSFSVRPKRPCIFSKSPSLALFPTRCYPGRFRAPVDKREADTPYETYPKGWKPPASIAVLGGGLTGLVTAHRLARLLGPRTKITIYESSNRLGGWVDTEELKDDQGRSIFFERGARMVQVPRRGSLKMDDVPFYHLIEELGLEDQVVGIARGTPFTPYIYSPGHLVAMPQPGLKGALKMLRTILTEDMFDNLPLWVVHAVGTRPKYKSLSTVLPPDANLHGLEVGGPPRKEESLGAYYTRVLGDDGPVDMILSAMIHGIWGGDIWQLTSRRDPFGGALTRFRPQAPYEDWVHLDRGSVDAYRLLHGLGHGHLGQKWAGYSHLWFKDGFHTLTRALAAALEKCDNVTIKTDTPIASVKLNDAKNAVLVTAGKDTTPYEHVVSTLFADTLSSVTHGKLPSLAKFPAVTIQAVNLWYPIQGLNHPHMGAGFLIPQATGPDLNPEKALGVLFDSDRDLLRRRTAAEGPPPDLGTTLTVLLGGHHWDGIPADALPTAEEAGELAKAVVARHLGISAEHNALAVVSTKLCRECIPQHRVDHWQRMARARRELEMGFQRRLSVVGPSYQMPGVFGSITGAYDLAHFLAGLYPDKIDLLNFPVGPTGLSRFVDVERSYFVAKKNLPLRFPAYRHGPPIPTPLQQLVRTAKRHFEAFAQSVYDSGLLKAEMDRAKRGAEERAKQRMVASKNTEPVVSLTVLEDIERRQAKEIEEKELLLVRLHLEKQGAGGGKAEELRR